MLVSFVRENGKFSRHKTKHYSTRLNLIQISNVANFTNFLKELKQLLFDIFHFVVPHIFKPLVSWGLLFSPTPWVTPSSL